MREARESQESRAGNVKIRAPNSNAVKALGRTTRQPRVRFGSIREDAAQELRLIGIEIARSVHAPFAGDPRRTIGFGEQWIDLKECRECRQAGKIAGKAAR